MQEAGADIVCSEMISAKAVLYGDEKTFKLAALRDSERPAGIQLFGSEPAVMAEAARRISSLRPDYIDINMGCPVRKVFSNGEGSALLNDPGKAAAITAAVAKGRRRHTGKRKNAARHGEGADGGAASGRACA